MCVCVCVRVRACVHVRAITPLHAFMCSAILWHWQWGMPSWDDPLALSEAIHTPWPHPPHATCSPAGRAPNADKSACVACRDGWISPGGEACTACGASTQSNPSKTACEPW